MNIPHEEQIGPEALAYVERLLEQFPPAGPPVGLRGRVLALAKPVAAHRPQRRIGLHLWRSVVAAGLLAAIGLHLAAERVSARSAERIGPDRIVWIAEAEETAQMLGGEAGRRYLTSVLTARPTIRNMHYQPPAGYDEKLY